MKKNILFALLGMSLIFACKKKDDTPNFPKCELKLLGSNIELENSNCQCPPNYKQIGSTCLPIDNSFSTNYYGYSDCDILLDTIIVKVPNTITQTPPNKEGINIGDGNLPFWLPGLSSFTSQPYRYYGQKDSLYFPLFFNTAKKTGDVYVTKASIVFLENKSKIRCTIYYYPYIPDKTISLDSFYSKCTMILKK